MKTHGKTGLDSFPLPSHLNFSFEKRIFRCHNAMKFCIVTKLIIVSIFIFHTLHRNITHLALIARNTTKTLRGQTVLSVHCELWKYGFDSFN